MKKVNKGFTIIELLIVIAIIGILAATMVPKLFKEIRKATVAEVQHNLGVIRSRLSLDDTLSEEFPDLFSDGNEEKTDLLKSYSIEATPSFTGEDEISHEESSKVVAPRDNTGGWFYTRDTGEIYANLPNGAYTGDSEYEIWNELGSEDNNKPIVPDPEKNDWDNMGLPSTESDSVFTGSGGGYYENPWGSGKYVTSINPGVGYLGIDGAKLNGNFHIFIDDKLINNGSGTPNYSGQGINIPNHNIGVTPDSSKKLKIAFEYIDKSGHIKLIYKEIDLFKVN